MWHDEVSLLVLKFDTAKYEVQIFRNAKSLSFDVFGLMFLIGIKNSITPVEPQYSRSALCPQLLFFLREIETETEYSKKWKF